MISAAVEDVLEESQEAVFINVASFVELINNIYYILSNVGDLEVLDKDNKLAFNM